MAGRIGGRSGRGSSEGRGNFDSGNRFGFRDVTLDNHFKEAVSAQLQHFKNSPESSFTLEAMSREERKYVHRVAARFGLKGRSTGPEGNRRVTISRRPVRDVFAVSLAYDTQPLELDENIKKSLRMYFAKYPIDEWQVEQHLRSGLVSRKGQAVRSGKNMRAGEPLLIPPVSRELSSMKRFRETLPTYCRRSQILDAIRNNRVTLITGGTGCGKTTQVPQFLLEEGSSSNTPLRIICTQPRRMPAVAVASRVAKERNERLGDTVGYHIRLEQKTSPQTVLTYCTSGVLLRMFANDGIEQRVSHVILDEVHEREQVTDYLLILLKQAIKNRSDLKVILMSATMEGNLDLFMRYFEDVQVAHVHVPSRLHRVEKFSLAEVLAMTDYRPPKSIFGGIFGDHLSCRPKKLDRFPLVDEFRYDAATERESQSVRNENWRAGGTRSEMSSIRTVPNLTSLAVSRDRSSVFVQTCGRQAGGTVAAEASLIASSSTSALGSLKLFPGKDHQKKGSNFGDAIDQLAHKLATWSGVSNASEGVDAVQQAGNDKDVSSAAQPEGALQNTQTNVSSQEDVEDSSPDVYEYPDTEEELVRQRVVEQAVLQRIRAVEIDQIGTPQSNCYKAFPSPDFGMAQSHFPPPCAPVQFSFQRFSSVQPVVPQHQLGFTQMAGPPPYGLPPAPGPVMFDPSSPVGPNIRHPPSQFGNIQNNSFCSAPGLFNGNLQTASVVGPGAIPSITGPFTVPPPAASAATINLGQNTRQHSKNGFSSRPKSFDPSFIQVLRSTNIDMEEVLENYLELGGQQWTESIDQDLIIAVIKYCMDSPLLGSILVFLPGYDDILKIREKVLKEMEGCITTPTVLTLHSQMNSQDQLRVFDSASPGHRKVILSTNIAEASLTIDDVVFVIDCGKVKEKSYDFVTHVNQLKITWIAKSNAEQRAGRAGRCQPGYCFRLYSTEDYDKMLPMQIAEMKRAAIHDVVLHAKMYAPRDVPVKRFLSLAPEPPSPEAVDSSLQFLEQLGALYGGSSPSYDCPSSCSNECAREPELTDLGRHIAQLPLEPQVARLLLFGIALKCFNPVVTLVAALAYRDPFILPLDDERSPALYARDRLGRFDFSDHLTLLRAFYSYNASYRRHQFCQKNFLSPNVMKMIAGVRHQLVDELRRLRMIADIPNALEDPELNRNSGSWPVVQAAIVAGSYPGIGFVRAGNRLRKIRTSANVKASLHPGCIIKRQATSPAYRSDIINEYCKDEEMPTIEYLAFQELAKIDEGLTLRTVTAVPPLAVLLFGGPIRLKKEAFESFVISDDGSHDNSRNSVNDAEDLEDDEDEHQYVFELEPWLSFRGKFEEMRSLLRLRFKLMSYFLEVMKNPSKCENLEEQQLLSILDVVLSADHARSKFLGCNDLPTYKPRFASTRRDDARAVAHGEVHSQWQGGSGNEHIVQGYSNSYGAGFRWIPNRQHAELHDSARATPNHAESHSEYKNDVEYSEQSTSRLDTKERGEQFEKLDSSNANELPPGSRQRPRKKNGFSKWRKRDRKRFVPEVPYGREGNHRDDTVEAEEEQVPEDPCSSVNDTTPTTDSQPALCEIVNRRNGNAVESGRSPLIQEGLALTIQSRGMSTGNERSIERNNSNGARVEGSSQTQRALNTRDSRVRNSSGRDRHRQTRQGRVEEGKGKWYFECYNSSKYPFRNRGGNWRGRRSSRGGNFS